MPTIREVSGDSSLVSAAHYPDARGVHTHARAHTALPWTIFTPRQWGRHL